MTATTSWGYAPGYTNAGLQPAPPHRRHPERGEGPLYFAFAVVLACFAFALPGTAQLQPIQIHLIDGRTGQPVSGQRVIFVTAPYTPGVIEAQNEGEFYAATVSLKETLKLAVVQVSAQYFNQWRPCVKHGTANEPSFAVADVLSHGVVSPNTCNKRIIAKPEPGVLTVFIRPFSRWETFVMGMKN